MIEVTNISKSYADILAVDRVSVQMRENTVFGLIGTNGAGKSTVLRMIAGVLKADEGSITVDGIPVFDQVEAKKKIFFIADEPYFFANANAMEMEKYFSTVYEEFLREDFYRYLESFGLDKKRKINTFSKGMKKQLALLYGICSGARYLLCDETFDGLDPVMRQGIKSVFAKEMESRGLTPIIASHNLRELEDMKCNIQKVQCVFSTEEDKKKGMEGVDIIKEEKRGSLHTLTVRGSREEIIGHFATVDTVFFEALPLSLEEIFISETEVAGYDVKKLIFG